MNKINILCALLLASAVLAACGPTQADLDAQSTRVAGDIYATMTAQPTATSTLTPTSRPTDTPAPTDTPTVTWTPTPTATKTKTPAPPTATMTPTRPPATATPRSVTQTPRPTQPPLPTQTQAAALPTESPSMPGVDVVAARGGESCVNKFVSVAYTWKEEDGRGMYYWDRNWSVYPMYARPNIKIETARGVCNDQNECSGLTADFCVYVDGGAPPGGTFESVLTLAIFSAYSDGSGLEIITETQVPFTWYIK